MKNFAYALSVVMLPIVLMAADKPVFYSSLDTEQYLKVPQIGQAAIINREVRFGEGYRGGAMHVREGAGSVAFPLPQGLPVESGMIEFAAKIDNDREWYRDAGDPTFFSIFDEETAKTMFMAFEINANNGIAKSGWYFRMTYLGWTTSLPNFGWHINYKTCFGESDPKAWHTYKIRWNINGVDGSADTVRVYMDDKQILSNQKKPSDLEGYRKRMTTPCRLYFAREFHEPGQNHSDYWIDEFKIWGSDTPVKEGDGVAAKSKKRVARLSDSPELAERKRREKEAAEAEAKRAAEAAKTLSDWACGPFVGGSDDSSVEFTVESNGRLRGTYKTIEKIWSLAAEKFVLNDLTNNVCEIAVEYSCGEEKSIKPLVITPLSARAEGFEAWMCEWNTNPAWIGVAKRLEGQQSKIVEDEAIIRLDVTTNALVEVMLATDKHVFETRTTLVPSPDSASEFRAFVCVPRDAEKAFDGFAGEITIEGSDLEK